VPCLVVDHQRWRLASRGGLANVAPTVLQLMGLEIPSEMALGSVLQEALPEKTRSRTERYAA
jgi:2,3-bisphosphoglycerate-independent phosphoglycerate mutase